MGHRIRAHEEGRGVGILRLANMAATLAVSFPLGWHTVRTGISPSTLIFALLAVVTLSALMGFAQAVIEHRQDTQRRDSAAYG